MKHGIISYIIDDDDVHMVNTLKQIDDRIRCVQYHQYQAFNLVVIVWNQTFYIYIYKVWENTL